MAKKKLNNKTLYSLAFALIFITAAVLILEKTNIINLHNGRSGDQLNQTDAETVEGVDYNPASSTENEDINNKKATGTVDQAPAAPTNDTAIQITFIANAQDASGGQLEVRTLLSGVTDGKCDLTLAKGSSTIQKTSSVSRQNTYFICDAFIIPYSELSNGDWTIKLKVTSGDGRTNEASTSTTIN